MEDINNIDPKDDKKYLVPMNMVPIDKMDWFLQIINNKDEICNMECTCGKSVITCQVHGISRRY